MLSYQALLAIASHLRHRRRSPARHPTARRSLPGPWRRRSKGGLVPTTGFIPSRHGFHFRNDFAGKQVIVPGFGEVPTRGRGGGMAYAALDYWYAGLPVPTHQAEDFESVVVPHDGSRLSDYLYKRLFDSFATWTARQFVIWTLAADQATWADAGVIARTRQQQLPRLRRAVDAGRPVVLGLVAASTLDDLGANHQVVAHAYDADDVAGTMRIHVYDPDRLDQEVVLSLDETSPYLESSVAGERWRGCFVQDYVPERPPYQDLAVSRGIWVNSWTPTLGRHFVAQYTVRNYGDHPARLSELCVAVRGPSGERLDHLLGGDGDPTPLEPGAERALFKAVVSFTHATVEDADALGGRLSLGLAVNGQHVQWPPDSPLEVSDGKTFDIEERFELALSPNKPLTVTVAGAGANAESGGVVCERWLGLDNWGRGEHSYRSRIPSMLPAGPEDRWTEGAYTINFLIETSRLEDHQGAGHVSA